MKTLVLFLMIFSIKSFSQDFYTQIPDCYCQPFPEDNTNEYAVNLYGSHIDTCEIKNRLKIDENWNLEETKFGSRCNEIAIIQYGSTGSTKGEDKDTLIKKYVKRITLNSNFNLFESKSSEPFRYISEISDKYFDIKKRFFDVENHIGSLKFINSFGT